MFFLISLLELFHSMHIQITLGNMSGPRANIRRSPLSTMDSLHCGSGYCRNYFHCFFFKYKFQFKSTVGKLLILFKLRRNSSKTHSNIDCSLEWRSNKVDVQFVHLPKNEWLQTGHPHFAPVHLSKNCPEWFVLYLTDLFLDHCTNFRAIYLFLSSKKCHQYFSLPTCLLFLYTRRNRRKMRILSGRFGKPGTIENMGLATRRNETYPVSNVSSSSTAHSHFSLCWWQRSEQCSLHFWKKMSFALQKLGTTNYKVVGSAFVFALLIADRLQTTNFKNCRKKDFERNFPVFEKGKINKKYFKSLKFVSQCVLKCEWWNLAKKGKRGGEGLTMLIWTWPGLSEFARKRTIRRFEAKIGREDVAEDSMDTLMKRRVNWSGSGRRGSREWLWEKLWRGRIRDTFLATLV